MIEFFDNDANKGNVSIYDNHITLSKSFIKFLGDAYKVRIGVEKEAKKIYIFLINKDYALSGEIKESSLLSVSISKSYARICSKAVVEYLTSTYNLIIPKGEYLRFNAMYDESKKAIVIEVRGDE